MNQMVLWMPVGFGLNAPASGFQIIENSDGV